MYVLAYVKNAEPPTEGFNLSNSSFPDVNGDYHRVTVQGIDDDDYNAIYQYLVNQDEFDQNTFTDDIATPIYFNGKTYVFYGEAYYTRVVPRGGNGTNNYYYTTDGGGPWPLSEGDQNFLYNVSPGITANPQTSQDWTKHTFPTVTSYDGKTY